VNSGEEEEEEDDGQRITWRGDDGWLAGGGNGGGAGSRWQLSVSVFLFFSLYCFRFSSPPLCCSSPFVHWRWRCCMAAMLLW